MSKEQQVRDAFDDVDELLLEGVSVNDAVSRAAEDNGLMADVLRVRLARQFGDLEARRLNLKRQAVWRERDRAETRALQDRLNEVREAAAQAAEGSYFACCLNDPEHAGRPSWPQCIDSLTKRLGISDPRLRDAVRETVLATVRRLDREHGTKTAHYQ